MSLYIEEGPRVDHQVVTWVDDTSTAAHMLELMQRPEWHEQAACRGMGPELFFPTSGEGVAEAKRVCESCPVIEQCRKAGQGERTGMWGGMSERQRRRAREKKPTRPSLGHLANCGTDTGYYKHRALGQAPCEACKAAHSAATVERSKKTPGQRRAERDSTRYGVRRAAGFCSWCAEATHSKCAGGLCTCPRCEAVGEAS